MDDVRVINPQAWKTFALKLPHKLELFQVNDMFRLYTLTLNPQGSLLCPILTKNVSYLKCSNLLLCLFTYCVGIKLDCNL